MQYFGCARKPGKAERYGILLVTKEPGRMSSQEWTGAEFKSWRATVAEVERLNHELFASPNKPERSR